MNYFAHAVRFLDRPAFSIGTTLPDMLSVLDRRMRLRSKRVDPFADGSGSLQAELAAGALQHLHDDRWFHSTPGFYRTTGELTRLFRTVLGEEDRMRCPFLGHIVTELQLDGALIEREPGLLDRFYRNLDSIDPDETQTCVNRMATRQSDLFATLIRRFREDQFLRDYSDPSRLLYRLNRIMLRVRLDQLPDAMESVLAESWFIVRERVSDLLPEKHFDHQI